MTLVGLLNDFLLQKKIGGLSPKTIDSYKNALHVFVLYAGDSLSLKELTQNLVNAYILDLYDRDLSRATVSTYVRSLKIFLRWIHQEYTLCFDPTKIKIPKSPKKIVHIYSDSEIRLIFSVIQNISSIPWINARNAAMVSLMLDSGIRQCEVCGLLRENMDFYGGRMKVLGKGAKERIVPLGILRGGIFVSKDDLIKEIYLRVSDETDMGDLVKEEDFVAVVRQVLYDYVLVSEASIVH